MRLSPPYTIKTVRLCRYITLVSFRLALPDRGYCGPLPDLPHAFTTLWNLPPPTLTHPSLRVDDVADGKYPYLAAPRLGAMARHGGVPMIGATNNGDGHGERVLRAIAAAGGRGWFADWRMTSPARDHGNCCNDLWG